MHLPYNQASDFYHERDFGQKISATLEFIGAHWRPLGRVLAYVILPVLLVRSVLQVLIQRYLPVVFSRPAPGQLTSPGGALDMQAGIWKSLFISPAYWLGSLIGSISLILLILSMYGYVTLLAQRRAPGPPPAVAEVWAVVRSKFVGAFLSLWVVGLLVGVSFLLLLVPGFYLGVVLSLFFIIQLNEGSGFGATFSRCWLLMRGKWWSTFGLIAIALLLYYVVMAGIGGVAVLVSGGFSAMLQAARTRSPLVSVVIACIGSLSTLLLYPPLLLALAFQYFNLVERHEGTGLRLLVDTLGRTAAPQARNATYQPTDEGEY
ncbi:hypothetical protein Q5H92_12110 [Hymenobacter sp. M29]|uniref:Glycerophosphoryl diester phosphodiesterase membrane domain-containing protein n=1 Tax=Hymenobacter mellowenesis TaxID=3063995 RepID=A0ABT9AB79_9BACT|nr:hypothetical protein [Hymenobacter sp. M29]MDO7847107.1 hypothetical protein [Hymenobacter sp. M29]